MYSVPGDTTSLVPGFPIRTSSDPRSVDNSPRHIAASHVLHRLPVPRHPPCALKHLQHKTKSFYKHTFVQTKKLHINRQTHPPQTLNPVVSTHSLLDARNHYPQIKHHPPPPKRSNNTPLPAIAGKRSPPVPHHQGEEVTGLLSQSPIVCLMIFRKTPIPSGPTTFVVHQNPTHYRCGPSIESPKSR